MFNNAGTQESVFIDTPASSNDASVICTGVNENNLFPQILMIVSYALVYSHLLIVHHI